MPHYQLPHTDGKTIWLPRSKRLLPAKVPPARPAPATKPPAKRMRLMIPPPPEQDEQDEPKVD